MEEDLQLLEDLDSNENKDEEDLKSVLNKKSYSDFELEEVMMDSEELL